MATQTGDGVTLEDVFGIVVELHQRVSDLATLCGEINEKIEDLTTVVDDINSVVGVEWNEGEGE